MSRIPVSFTFYIFCFFLLILPRSSPAQRTFGVAWDIPGDANEARQQLDRFEELKITYLELDQIVSEELWAEIKKRDFNVYIQIPVKYPVVETFSEADSSLVRTYQRFLTHYGRRQVAGIGAFAYGQTNNPSFADAVAPFTEQISSSLSLPIYFKAWSSMDQAINALFDFTIAKINVSQDFQSKPDSTLNSSEVYLYHPEASLEGNIAPLKWFFQRTSINPSATLFFDSDWLLQFVNEHKSAERILIEQATYQDAVFPLPQENLPSKKAHSVIVLILLIVWGTVALTYSFIPTYRRSLFRFFFSHKFFIEDVMNRHIRSLIPSFILLVQHSILGGIFLYSVASIFFSTTGLNVIYHYFPMLALLGTSYFSFFFLGIIFTILFQFVSLGWLYFANRSVGYLSQIAILYSWPFHINLVITTIIVTLLMAGTYFYVLATCLILFVVILLLDFPVTAYDTGQDVKEYKWLYAVGTLGVYTLLLAIVLLTVFTNNYLLHILDLAIAIS